LHRGDMAFWLRTSMREADARPQVVLDSLLGGFFSNMTVEKEIQFEGDGKDGQATLSYRGRSQGGLARMDGTSLIFELRTHTTLASKYAPLATRTLPVVLPPQVAPSTETHSVTIEAPVGYKLETPDYEANEAGGAFGSVHVKVRKLSERRALIERTTTFDQHEIPVKDYEAFRSWLVRADSILKRGVRFSGGAQ
jgi:hypothetical protein